jgi:molybdenum cofactor cytidylyltransferase
MLTLDCVIMAAGLSKRMGKNKLMLKINEKTIIENFLNNLPFEKFRKINMVYFDENVRDKCSDYKIHFIKNNVPEKGKGYTIFLGQKNSMNSDGTMYFVADQPFLTKNTILKLIDEFLNFSDKIIIPKVKHKTFNPVIYPSFCYNDLLKIGEDRGGKSILKKYESQIKLVEFENEMEFTDIDTQEEYDKIFNK